MKKSKLICCISFILVTVFSNAQNTGNIQINGIIKGINVKKGTATLIPISIGLDCIGYKFDSLSVAVIDNHFHFSGFMPYPHGFDAIIVVVVDSATKATKSFGTPNFFLDSGDITVTCFYGGAKPVAPDIKFSQTNYEYQNKFLPGFNSVEKLLDSYRTKWFNDAEKYHDSVPHSIHEETVKLRNEYAKERNAFLREYIKQNPGSFIPLAMLGQSLGRMSYDIVDIENTFSFLSSEMKNTVSGSKLKNAFKIMKTSSVTDSLKVLSFIDEKNIQKKVEFYYNRYTLVDFWFSSCRPCIAQFSKLSSIYNTYRDKGFEIIGISTDKNIDDWRNAISKYKVNWQQLWDGENLTSDRLLIRSFPTNFLLDTKGKIIAANIEPSELENFLEENIK